MASNIELEQYYASPYKQTRLFVKGGKTFFGIWKPLPVQIDGDESQITIQEGMEGQLDLLAAAYYGDRSLWYVIAYANKIDLPIRDLVAGMTIIIPKPSNVRAALLSTVGRQQGVVG